MNILRRWCGASVLFLFLGAVLSHGSFAKQSGGDGSRCGYVDKSGQLVIAPRFEAARSFADGLAPVEMLGKWGYIDKGGKVVIPARFDDARPFSEGLAAVKAVATLDVSTHSPTLWGFIDKMGKIVVEPQFEEVRPFSEGLAAAKLTFHDKRQLGFRKEWCFIDRNGKIVIQPEFMDAKSFAGGLAAVEVVKEGWGFIDKKGVFVVRPKYQWVGEFNDGLWPVLNARGGLVLRTFGYNAVVSGGLFGFVDKAGQQTVKPAYDGVSQFSQGVACVASGEWDAANPLNKWAYVDKNGAVLLKGDFSMGRPFSEGMAPVARGRWQSRMFNAALVNAKWGFVDKSGKLVVAYQFDDAHPFSDGLSRVETDSKVGFVDHSGKQVIEAKYDDAGDFSEGLAWVKISDPRVLAACKAPLAAEEQKQTQDAWTEQVVALAKRNWQPPSRTATTRAVAVLSLDERGNISDLTISESSGDEEFDETALDACREPSQYPSPPKNLSVPVKVAVTFHYKVKKDQQAADARESKETAESAKRSAAGEFAPYEGYVQWLIKQKWQPPKQSESKHTVVRFSIAKDGRLLDVRVHQSSGVPAVDEAALEACREASPLPPPPPGVPLPAETQMTFDYNVHHDKPKESPGPGEPATPGSSLERRKTPTDEIMEQTAGLLEQHKFGDLVEVCNRGLARRQLSEPEAIAFRILRGSGQMGLGQFQKAAEDFSWSLNHVPLDDSELSRLKSEHKHVFSIVRGAHKGRWVCNMALGQSEKAVVDATKLTLLEPESADGYIALGLAHFGSGEFDKVIDDFSNAIKRDPRERVAYEIRGLTYALQGRGDLAMTDWVYMMRLPGKEDDGQRSIMTLVDNASSLKGIAQRQLLAGLQKYSNHLRQSSDDDGAKRIDEMVERLRSRLGASSADQSD